MKDEPISTEELQRRLLIKEGEPDAFSRPEISSIYNQARREFHDTVARAERVSRGSGGVFVTEPRIYWAAVLYTRIVVTAKSILKMLPDTKPGEHWDFSAVASLTRNLSEAYLFYFWLVEDEVLPVVRDGRFILLNLHDHAARRRIFASAPAAKDEVFEDLRVKFFDNAYLKNLPEKRRNELLKADKTPFVQDELIDRMGGDKEKFRQSYRFHSQHTHTGPISFYRIAEHDRGKGVETRMEKLFTITAIGIAAEILTRAISGHLKIFPDAETRAPHLTDKEIRRNVEVAEGRSK